ncbi:MAG: hypothetical protein BWY81_00053 [Firmicutes bacterium ADurb.Bin467]|nr:MAG: hypothetical protein BWY81_00053 [Firmicutes bacterium ADurb.Bin467]
MTLTLPTLLSPGPTLNEAVNVPAASASTFMRLTLTSVTAAVGSMTRASAKDFASVSTVTAPGTLANTAPSTSEETFAVTEAFAELVLPPTMPTLAPPLLPTTAVAA